jgi:hypothetical protein
MSCNENWDSLLEVSGYKALQSSECVAAFIIVVAAYTILGPDQCGGAPDVLLLLLLF